MKEGHFHCHTAPVSRSNGHSAVAAAAYQSNQELKHEQQQLCSVDITHRKRLNKGIVTDELRAELKKNKITLSTDAVAEKGDKRRYWTITDGENKYQVREYTVRKLNKEKGIREVVEQGLRISADSQHDYTRKKDVAETWIQAPDTAPDWVKEMEAMAGGVSAKDRQSLWNTVEQANTYNNAQPARQIDMSFVRELSFAENKHLLQEFVSEHFTSKGLVVDVAIHNKAASDGGENTHAHVLFSTRAFNAKGDFSKKKDNDYLHKEDELTAWRKGWADKQNAKLHPIVKTKK